MSARLKCVARYLLVVIFLVSAFASCTKEQNASESAAVQLKPENPVDVFEQNQALGRGVDMGNALEAPSEGEWGMTVKEEYLQLISDAGFDAIRLPVRWNAHAGQDQPYTIAPDFFDRVDEVLQWALDRDLVVVLNLHHYRDLMAHPQQNHERFLALWKQVASHYADAPNSVIFEILNEPNGKLTPDLYNQYLAEAINVVRQSNPYRTLMAGTDPWGGVDGIKNLELPEDDRNIIVTVHYYEPMQFTHQGADWVDNSDQWLGTTWTATEAQKDSVNADFDMVKKWADEHNRPIYLGEFGAYNEAPMESRITWTSYIREAAEQRNFSWSYWEFGSGFGIYDREEGQWRSGLLKALLPDTPVVE